MDRRMVMGIPVTSSWCIKLRQITLNLILLSEFQTNNSTFNQDICLLHVAVRNRTCRDDDIFAIRNENFSLGNELYAIVIYYKATKSLC